MPLSVDHLSALTDLVAPGSTRAAADLATLDPGVDPHNFGAELMVRPSTVAEVSRVLAYCHAAGIGVVPHGGRTGLSGGAVSGPGEIILSMDRFTAIEQLDPLSRTAVVGAGVPLSVLSAAVGAHELAVGIDLGARDSATIGGMLSTNAGGSEAFRYGTIRERVLGLEVVLPDGSVLSELGRVRKRNEGLAVEQLFIGAEGTLGVITRACLALVPANGPTATALVATPELATAVALTDRLRRDSALTPTGIEIMSRSHATATIRALGLREFEALTESPFLLLVEAMAASADAAQSSLVSALEAAVEVGDATDAVFAQNEAQRHAMWRVREDWAVDRERPGGLWYDISVPLAALPAYVDGFTRRIAAHDPVLGVCVIGHLGDGNLHLTVNAPQPITARYDEIARLVTEGLREAGGSFSAEHGIGLEKKATLERCLGPVKQELMRRLKQTIDPKGIMNRGKVVPA